MKNNDFQKGASSTIVVIAVLIVLVAAGIYYYLTSSQRAVTTTTESPTNSQNDQTSRTPEDIDNTPTPSSNTPSNTSQNTDNSNNSNGQATQKTTPIVIHFTGTAYDPSNATIKKGDSIIWINDSDTPTWPASAVHPTHAVYPTTGGCVGSTFDACKALSKGESFTFKFDFVGIWAFHDHLNPSKFGKVTVTE